MNFCSNCGSRVTLRIPDGDTHIRFVCDHCNTIHYKNPKVIVGTVPVFDNRILLCKRAIEPRYGKWTVPAGFLENNETTEEGAFRETYEEAGIDIKICHLHVLYSIPHVSQVYIIFLAQMTSERFNPGLETLECRFFKKETIPWDEIAFTSIRFCLEKLVAKENWLNRETFTGQHQGKKNS